jgi:CheY-like chemotaxis protein
MQANLTTPPSSSLLSQAYQRRILHLDGTWKTHELIRGLVEKACPDCELVTVENGTEALRLIDTEPFDLVIVDPWANEVNGFAVCRHAAAHKPGLPVFFYAQQKLMNDKKFAEAAGAAAFFLDGNFDEFVEAMKLRLS